MKQDNTKDKLEIVYELLGIAPKYNLKDLVELKKQELNISSDRQLSNILNINKDTLSRLILSETQKIDLLSIIKLSNFLNKNIEDVIKLYVAGMSAGDIKEIEDVRKKNFILRHFDIEQLYKIGFLKSKTDFDVIEKKITNYYNLDSIYEYDNPVLFPLYSKKKTQSQNDLMDSFWIKSAYSWFESVNNPYDFDYNEFERQIPKIRAYTQLEEKGLLTVIRALFRVGITVIVQKYVTNTNVKGATFIVNDKPCIVLTDVYDRYDLLWFTLFHELCHILYDLDDLKINSYHLSGSTDLLLLNEERANLFARSMLFADDKLEFIKQHIDNHFVVQKYAKTNNVHSSIIYGFYLYDCNESIKNQKYKKFRKYLVPSEMAIKNLKKDLITVDNPQVQLKKIIELISN